MKLLMSESNHDKAIHRALELTGTYSIAVVFHSYWNGILNEKHLYSILSCYYFHVHNNKHKIILWLENNIPNQYNTAINKYAEIIPIVLQDEKKKTNFLENYQCDFSDVRFYSDFVRNVLLYNYGGVWFDLDCFFLRCFDPIFHTYGHEICLYEWEKQRYPNNAIYISLEQRSETLKKNIQFIIKHDCGWGFQQANLTYDVPMDILILPCSWFDPDWIHDASRFQKFFQDTNEPYTFETFYKGSFCYHWHNKWDWTIQENSIFMQLVRVIEERLS